MRSSTLRSARKKGLTPEDKTLVVQWPWWVHPGWALLLLTGSMALISISLPDSDYATWNVPKFLDGDMSVTLLIGIISMFIGIMFASAGAARGGQVSINITARQVTYLRKAYRLLFLLAIVGYVIWIGSALSHGVSVADLMSVVDRQLGAISDLKKNSRPIGGLTTLTQFAPVAVALGYVLKKIGAGGKGFWILILMAGVRTVFYAERLALIEIVIPLLIVASLTVSQTSKWRGLARSAPLIVAPMIWGVFAISEYTRSWVYYQMTTNTPFLEWVSVRLAGYYVTSFNNSALFVRAHEGSNAAPYFTFDAFWNAPGVPESAHGGIWGFQAEDWWSYILATETNREYTNIGSFLMTYGELGMLGMVLFWLVAGLVVGGIFANLTKGSVPALVAYAGMFVGVLELPRFIYWTQGRATPILLAALIIAMSYPKLKARTRRSTLPAWGNTHAGRRLLADEAERDQLRT